MNEQTTGTATAEVDQIINQEFPQEFLQKIQNEQFDPAEVRLVLADLEMRLSLSDVAERARAIVVTDESQTALMQQARELRLKFRSERVRIDKVRQAIKEPYLRKTQVIDGVARLLRRMFEDVEEHLQLQEDFAKIREKQRTDALAAERREQLAVYGHAGDVDGLGSIPEANFELILAGAKARFKEAEAEKARLAREEEERLRREKELADENERLRREKAEADARAAAEADARRKAEDEARLEREAADRRELERLAAEEAERKRVAEEKARAAAAPDRDKILAFGAALTAVELPAVTSPEAKAVVEMIRSRRKSFVADIATYAAELRVENEDCPF